MVKAQVLVGGRGKSGGIKEAHNPEEAEKVTEAILAMDYEGIKVTRVLVEEKLDVTKEIYAAATSNVATRTPVSIFSLSGGMDIEEVKEKDPQKIITKDISILKGLSQFEAMNTLRKVSGLNSAEIAAYGRILASLYDIYRKYDCKLVEINPLVVTARGVVAADARVDIDDDAIGRHPDLGIEISEEAGAREPTALEIAAGQIDHKDHRGSAHLVQIDPAASYARQIGKIPIGYNCVGTGCAITLFDEIFPLGYSPVDFCDTSGNPPSIKMYAATKIVFSQPEIRGYLMVTGMAAQLLDNTARGIIKALKELYPETGGKPNIPCLLCFRGRQDEVAVQLFREHGISDSPWFKVLGRNHTEKDAAEEFDRLYQIWVKETGGI
jgi:succinyl-CoA synthetase beta subunit